MERKRLSAGKTAAEGEMIQIIYRKDVIMMNCSVMLKIQEF